MKNNLKSKILKKLC